SIRVFVPFVRAKIIEGLYVEIGRVLSFGDQVGTVVPQAEPRGDLGSDPAPEPGPVKVIIGQLQGSIVPVVGCRKIVVDLFVPTGDAQVVVLREGAVRKKIFGPVLVPHVFPQSRIAGTLPDSRGPLGIVAAFPSPGKTFG